MLSRWKSSGGDMTMTGLKENSEPEMVVAPNGLVTVIPALIMELEPDRTNLHHQTK